MRKKIQHSMLLVSGITLILSYLFFTLFSYHQAIDLLKEEVNHEAEYIVKAMDQMGESYLEGMDEVDPEVRITLIDPDGNVRYDSGQDAETLKNHKNRPEIQEALKTEIGEDVRYSETKGKELYYYARKLKNGEILRVSRSMDSLAHTAFQVFPTIVFLGILMLLVAWGLSTWQTKKLIKPINELDVEHPLKETVYEELNPLLEAIDHQNKEKDAIANMRKEFSANVSHELKTPLTSISGYAEIIQNGLVRPEDIPEFSGRIYKEAKRLITLVEDIIKLSRLDEEAVDIEKTDVDLYELSREICSRLSQQSAEKQVRLTIKGERVSTYGIRQVLDEMIYNVIENAVKYNVPNGSVDVWVGNTLAGPKIVVSDTGIGIPKEHQERIFERFYRVDKSHSKERGGTGLGLSIVKHGALLHHAKVQVDSEPGKGTKIQIQFPVKSPEGEV